MTSISSRPKLPPSPACGLSPATAMRGAAKSASRIERSASLIASTIATTVISAATADSGMCDVTRAFQTSSRTLNSLAGPVGPEHFAREADFVVVARMGARIAALLNGVKQTASTRRAPPSSSAVRKFASANSPPVRVASPSMMRAGSRFARLTNSGLPAATTFVKSGGIRCPVRSGRPPRRPAKTRESPMTMMSAASLTSGNAMTFTVSSALMPAGSPMASAMSDARDVAKQFSVGWRLLPAALDYEYSACWHAALRPELYIFFVTVKTLSAEEGDAGSAWIALPRGACRARPRSSR